MASFIFVKKYNNRKLYIPDEKKYTNLKRLSKEVLNNKKILCTMVPSGTDNTKNTLIDVLASFIFENGQKLSNEYIYNLIHIINKQLNTEVQDEKKSQ